MAKKEVKPVAVEMFYRDIYRNALATKYHNDIKANWILAISAGIMSVLITYVGTAVQNGQYGYLVMFESAFISFILGLMILVIPRFFKLGAHDDKDLMYFNRVRKIMGVEEYAKKLKDIDSKEKVAEQYSRDLFNMYGRNISVKNQMLKVQVDILLLGILIGGLLLFFV